MDLPMNEPGIKPIFSTPKSANAGKSIGKTRRYLDKAVYKTAFRAADLLKATGYSLLSGSNT